MAILSWNVGCNPHIKAQTGTNKISSETFKFTIIVLFLICACFYFSILFAVEAWYFLTELMASLLRCMWWTELFKGILCADGKKTVHAATCGLYPRNMLISFKTFHDEIDTIIRVVYFWARGVPWSSFFCILFASFLLWRLLDSCSRLKSFCI